LNQLATRIADTLDKVRSDANSTIGDRREGGHNLQRRHADFLADGDARSGDLRPSRGASQYAGSFPGKLNGGSLAEPETSNVSIEAIVAERHADANGADIRRAQHHVFETH